MWAASCASLLVSGRRFAHHGAEAVRRADLGNVDGVGELARHLAARRTIALEHVMWRSPNLEARTHRLYTASQLLFLDHASGDQRVCERNELALGSGQR
jgi:hypothetical protein